MNGKFNPKTDAIKTCLSKIRTLFFDFKKGQRRSPLSSLFAWLLRVCEYASVSLNMPKYHCKCLDKPFWVWQGSEYAWSSDMFNRLLEFQLSQVLNMAQLFMQELHRTEFQIFLIMAHILVNKAWMCLNMP